MAFPFISINVETTDWCNRKCHFCPNSLIDKPPEYMPLGMFTDIMYQLREGGYEGRLHLYQRGEPLTDERIVDLTSMARRMVPKCHLYISTNGDYLTRKMAHQLIAAGMNEIEVSHYDGPRVELMRETSHLHGYVFHYDKKLSDPIGHWFNRGGLVDVPASAKFDNNVCWWIFQKMAISCVGDYIICCAEWFPGRFGNIKDKTLMELWEGDLAREYRGAHMNGRARTMPMCDKCNMLEG